MNKVKKAFLAVFFVGLIIMVGAAGKSDLGANMGEFLPQLAIGLVMVLVGFAVAYTAEKYERG